MKNSNWILVALFCGLIATRAQALSLNDISVLVPLPEVHELSLLLSPAEQGAQGVLIPEGVFQALPPLVPEYDNTVTYRDQLKVIGVRIDPCFVEGLGPWECRRQIRLVWQPVIASADAVTTRDAAVHSFYEFDKVGFQKVWNEWRALSTGSHNEPLQIHPLLQSQGLTGHYWKELRNLLLENCGEKNLVRVTAMNVMSGEQLWIFMGFDVVSGKTTPIPISRIGRTSQGVIISSSGFKNFNGRVMPPPQQDPDTVRFIADSVSFRKNMTEKDVKALIGTMYGYENPQKHNPGTLDCVSCHVANSAIQWGEVNFPQWDWNADFQATRYQGAGNLRNITRGPLRTNQLRAFGYFQSQPAISQRVINETAAALQILTTAK